MRYINKAESPLFFEECKQSLSDLNRWETFSENQPLSRCKQQLHRHLLDEQSGLCVYCEREVTTSSSHIEHVYPKSTYPDKTFDYQNLVTSCNGESCSIVTNDIYKPEDIQSCGHRKSDLLDEQLFVSPLAHVDIGNYFSYNKTSCAIMPSGKSPSKASYTIDLLNLGNTRLNNERSNARVALIQATTSFLSQERKNKIQFLLSKDRPFISFLRYNFSPFLAE
uniref:TIGR02646 family protein n=1 Tax=uncultured Thiotrichaceae bacterium TaxID=298394 RepID=A0A6S6SXK8_9GAMM|nr:MAG: TIGR02646 family protein [uncultured Thiotrichaceae bacterium]